MCFIFQPQKYELYFIPPSIFGENKVLQKKVKGDHFILHLILYGLVPYLNPCEWYDSMRILNLDAVGLWN